MQIAVSIDSLQREVFSKIRGADKLDLVLEGLDRLIMNGPKVTIKANLTLNRFNYQEIPDFLAMCREKGIFLSIFPVNLGSNFRHRGLDTCLLPTEDEKKEMGRTFQEIAQLRKKGEIFWEHSSFYTGAVDYIKSARVAPCDAGRLFFDLHADGKIAVCNDLPPFGDLTRESFRECVKRLPQQQDMIKHCYQNHPCYYTCTYAISAISKHELSYILENVRMMGISGIIRNFLKNTRRQ